MLKTEMTQQQLNNRSLFIGKLREAKWKINKGWELLFEHGHSLTPEGQAEYQNPRFELRLSYYIDGGYVFLECVGRDNPIVLSLRFYPIQKFNLIVDAVIAVQDNLSPNNYSEFVKKMIQLCDPLLIETAEGLIQASLSEAAQN
jgi:hypothetical protein